MENKEFLEQAKIVGNELIKLSTIWEGIEDTYEIDSSAEKNINYLPSFDEFVLDWLEFYQSIKK